LNLGVERADEVRGVLPRQSVVWDFGEPVHRAALRWGVNHRGTEQEADGR
jgi:hypothetical protein